VWPPVRTAGSWSRGTTCPEVSKDPSAGDFDFRSYKLWKVSDWRRPTGTTGPSDEEWRLLAQYRYFDYFASNIEKFSVDKMQAREYHATAFDSVAAGTAICPQVPIPNLSLQTVVFAKGRLSAAHRRAGMVQQRGMRHRRGQEVPGRHRWLGSQKPVRGRSLLALSDQPW
jgi:hypothetical protein